MTPQERAEKIADMVAYLSKQYDGTDLAIHSKQMFVAKIEEAELEAERRGQQDCKMDGPCQTAFLKGFTAAREKAKEIAETWRCRDKGDKCYPCDCGGEVPQDAIADRIGKMEP